MLSLEWFQDSRQRAPALIFCGLAVVLWSQVWPVVPIASAVVLIGWGATLAVLNRAGRQEWLALTNLAVYLSLTCLTVVAQTNAALTGPAGRVETLVLIDHLAAVALLVIVTRGVLRQVIEPLAR